MINHMITYDYCGIAYAGIIIIIITITITTIITITIIIIYYYLLLLLCESTIQMRNHVQ